MIKYILTLSAILFCCSIYSQNVKEREQFNSTDLGFSYGYYLSGADLNERYGNSLIAQLSFNIFKAKTGIQYGAKVGVLTGREVKDFVFESARNNSGFVIADNGFPGDIITSQRGLVIGAFGSKNIFASKDNKRFIYLGAGFGVLQHKIRIRSISGFVPQYDGDYKKGYDRNSRGPYIEESIGLRIRKYRLNLDLEFEFIQGFTKNLRILNFDTREMDNERKLDVLMGFKATYYLTFLNNTEGKDIYY